MDSPNLGYCTKFLLTTGNRLNCQLEVEVGAPNGLAQTPAWARISVSQSEIVYTLSVVYGVTRVRGRARPCVCMCALKPCSA